MPNTALLMHLNNSDLVQSLPSVLTSAGLFLMASAYGIDLDERTALSSNSTAGCWIGVVFAPLFPTVLAAAVYKMRRTRSMLNSNSNSTPGPGSSRRKTNRRFGSTSWSTWRERYGPALMASAESSAGSNAAANGAAVDTTSAQPVLPAQQGQPPLNNTTFSLSTV